MKLSKSPNYLRRRQLSLSVSFRLESRQLMRRDSGKVIVGAAIVLAIITAAIFSDLANFSSFGSQRRGIGPSPASAALNTSALGKVLIAGGYEDYGAGILLATELYDPATNSFAAAANTAGMNAARSA